MKRLFLIFIRQLAFFVLLVVAFQSVKYALRNPEKTQTQLFLDMLHGEPFK